MQIETREYLDFDDVLMKPKRSSLSSRKEVYLEREFTFLHSKKKWKGIPIMASNMDTVGTWEMRDVLAQYHMPTMIHKFYDQTDWMIEMQDTSALHTHPTSAIQEFANNVKYTVPSFGIRQEDIEQMNRLIEWIEYFPNIVCFDVANGYTERYVNHIKQMRDKFGETLTIIAGNVATPEATEALVFAGADIVKVGIGSGSQCSTRMKAGIGIPQLTAIQLCSDAAHGLGAHIIADGGVKQVADISKAFGAGSDFVMVGGMLAAHDESGGEEKIEDIDPFAGITQKYKEVYGMSSEYAMKKHYGEKADYRSSEGNHQWIEHRGPVKNTIEDILGGLRSTMTYVGSRRLKDLSKCTTFVKVNRVK